jgi:hypothetical protein
MSKSEAHPVSEEDMNLILEPDFMAFNKIKTVLCRNNPCVRGKKCSFAHNTSELRKSICLYHFNNGCNKSDSACVHSHKDEDMYKSIIDYKKWKNPTPPPTPKPQLTSEELIQKFGEFKISLDDEDSETEDELDKIVPEDEDDKKLIDHVKESCKLPYEVIQSEDFMDVPDSFKKANPLFPIFPLEAWEIPKSDEQSPNTNEQAFPITLPMLYNIIVNQQNIMMTLSQNICTLSSQVEYLNKKVKYLENKDDSDYEDEETE